MDEKPMSPKPKKSIVATLDFPDAMRELIAGKKIHKLEWQNREIYGVLKDGRLKLHNPDGSTPDWILNDGDMLGTDWVVI
jgi:hypothetical protein